MQENLAMFFLSISSCKFDLSIKFDLSVSSCKFEAWMVSKRKLKFFLDSEGQLKKRQCILQISNQIYKFVHRLDPMVEMKISIIPCYSFHLGLASGV